MATYYRVGGKPKRYATLEDATAAASRLFARRGIVASVEEFADRGTRPPVADGGTRPRNLAQLRQYMTAGRVVYVSYSLARKRAGLDPSIRPRVPLAVKESQGNGFYWEASADVWPLADAETRGCWHRWGKAADYRFLPYGVAYEPDGGPQLTFYHFDPDPRTVEEYAEEDRQREIAAAAATEEETIAATIARREDRSARAHYQGEYERVGLMADTTVARGAIVHRRARGAAIRALIFGARNQPIALVGPFATVRDAADNCAAWDIPFYRTPACKTTIKADAERGTRLDQQRRGR